MAARLCTLAGVLNDKGLFPARKLEILKKMTHPMFLLPPLGTALFFSGCEAKNETAVEKAAESVEESAESAAESVEEAAEGIRDEIDDATTE